MTGVITTDKYDLTNVENISIEYDLNNTVLNYYDNGSYGTYLSVSSSSSSDTWYDEKISAYYVIPAAGLIYDNGVNKVISLDVSDLTGSYYIKFGGIIANGPETLQNGNKNLLSLYYKGPLKLY